MIREFIVGVDIFKGISRTLRSHKEIAVGFDDVPEETSKEELNEMARNEVNTMLSKTEDYRLYGKNWTIVFIHED